MGSGFLQQVCAEAHQRVADAQRLLPAEELRAQPRPATGAAGFAAALSGSDVAVIAEVKRASPSKGHIADIPHADELAAAYAVGGAAAVSVLTEPAHFNGRIADLEEVARTAGIPALRKDFVVDPYQVWEARAVGAAAVLLIVAALDDADLQRLLGEVQAAGLDALVEVHDEVEVARAAAAHAAAAPDLPLVVGINARDLASLQVDPSRFAAVRHAVPAGALAVAESGITGPEDVSRYAELGADAVLVGEHVALAPDPAAAVRALVAAGRRSPERSRP